MRWEARLEESVWALVNDAAVLYPESHPATARLRHQLARLEGPLRIAVAGPWQSGKSTLVNALMGEQVAPVELQDGRQVFTWYEDGPAPRATAYSTEGSASELLVTRSNGGMWVDPGGWRSEHFHEIVVQWPTRALRHATFVDTPAIPPPADDDGRTAISDRILRDADAVLCLTRDARGADLRFLRAAQDDPVARVAPVNAILVLSRADEVGGGRIDALLAAKQLARRHCQNPEVTALCMTAVALGGLVALAGRVLSESDFAALATLAATPRADLDGFLLSTDRFAGDEFPAPLGPEVRGSLLDRLGIFGVRLATTLIRTGCDTRASLAAELVRRSGLTELRESVARCFIDRQEVLKARSALGAVESMLRADPRPGGGKLLARLEHVLATAHDFRELRLLAALQDRRVRLDAELAAEAQRLIGGAGTSMAARLGVDHEATAAELCALSSGALGRWQHQGEDPLLGLAERRAAGVVVRSCEGMLAHLAAARR